MSKTFQFLILCVASLYAVLSAIISLPYTETFVGILVLIATYISFWERFVQKHYDGRMVVGFSESGVKVFSLELNKNPEDLELKDEVTFEVISDVA